WENSWTVLRDHSNLTRVDLRVDSGTCALSVWVDGRQVFLETPSWFQLPSAEDEWEVDAGRRLLARLAGALHPARGSARPVKAVWSRRWSRPLAAVLVLALTVWLVAAGIPFLSGSARAGQERQAAVKAYLDPTASGDAGGAWRRIVIDRSTLPAGADRGLLSESGLSKLLALPENSPGPATNLKVADAGAAGQDEFVEVAYTQAGRAVAGHLRLRPDSKLGWRVVLAPALLKLSTTVDVFVDGDPAG